MIKDFKKKTGYQIYIKSFQDSNGDGIGDLQGIIDRLDTLKELGIDFIWITPFFKSPQYDNGYDVSDYKSITPEFGDFDTFDKLIEKANSLNIDIMLDMVFNHSSTEHEWFQKAIDGDENYQKYYYFVESDAPPSNWESKFGGNAWEYSAEVEKYYLHLFHKKQADLNWHNKEVRRELKDVVRFWKEKGVKGFRFDVINLIDKPSNTIFESDYEGDGRRFYTDGPKVHQYLSELNIDTNLSENLTVGEMSSTTIENCIEYTNPKNQELDMVFNFHHLKVDYKDGQKWQLDDVRWDEFFNILDNWQKKMQQQDGWSAWFLNNHDQPRAISRFADDEKYHYESATLLATLTHMMRGTPYIYQGEEFGTRNPKHKTIEDYTDVESLNYYNILIGNGVEKDEVLNIIAQRSRDNGRTPVAWDNSENYGFTTGKPWVKFGNVKRTLEEDLNSEKSIFKYYKKLIKLRKNYLEISHGDYKKVIAENKVYIFERIYDENSVLVVLNFNDVETNIKASEYIKNKYENNQILINNYETYDLETLKPYQSYVIRMI